MAVPILIGKRRFAALVALAGLIVASGASAQTMNANSAGYNAGFGRAAGQENQPVNPTLRDANGNLVVVDGVIQAGADHSVFASAGASGVFDQVAGVGAGGGSTAIGNNLVVVTQGSNNTVIVNSKQTNSGAVSASSSLSGGVNNAQ
ncbi:MAG TPA: holdfast anchoring protein HfaA [Caulobacteraceae bacterium]|nr:holdfast anchoring protein HfaA [Caulobacteraceae bacterium]